MHQTHTLGVEKQHSAEDAASLQLSETALKRRVEFAEREKARCIAQTNNKRLHSQLSEAMAQQSQGAFDGEHAGVCTMSLLLVTNRNSMIIPESCQIFDKCVQHRRVRVWLLICKTSTANHAVRNDCDSVEAS